MSVADELTSISSGGRFFRADLHIHSFEGSHDVRDAAMTAEGIASTAVVEQLSVVAVADHNEITNVRRTLTAAQGKPLLVLPGVELSTPQGHLLAYFETLEDLESFYGKLTIASRGSQDSHCQTGMLDCLKLIAASHGFGILAHVDGDGGFERTVSGFPPHKAAVICAPALLGLELKSAQSNVSYSQSDPDPQESRPWE